MTIFLDLIERKPSKALQAMVDGLERFSLYPNVVIDMTTYGDNHLWDISSSVRFCAASCAIQQLTGKDYNRANVYSQNLRADFLGVRSEDLWEFEYVLDEVRRGQTWRLFKYCHLRAPQELQDAPYCLSTATYLQDLPLVKAEIKKLQEAGY